MVVMMLIVYVLDDRIAYMDHGREFARFVCCSLLCLRRLMSLNGMKREMTGDDEEGR